MRIVDTFDPSLVTSDTFNAGFPNGVGRIVVYNESNVNLKLSWGSFSTYCPAWTAMLYCISTSNININWQQQSTLVSTGAPISQVIVEAFDNNETIVGTFPAALVRQTNIGNTVSTAMGGSTSLQNDGNIQTTIIEATPSGAPSSTVVIDNEGNITIKGNNAGVLTTLLQLIAGASPAVKLAAAATPTEVLGNLQVDGSLNLMPTPTNVAGTVSGSCDVYYIQKGTIKEILLNFKAMKTNQVDLALPVSFTKGAHAIMGDGINLQFMLVGVAQNTQNVSGFNTFVAATNILAPGWGDVLAGFDTLRFAGTGAAAHSGWGRIQGV